MTGTNWDAAIGRAAAEQRRLVRRLQRLAAYRPALERGIQFGAWAGGEDLPDGTTQMPWYAFSAEADEFLNDVRGTGWVKPFDWPAWVSTKRGQRLMSDHDAVARATTDDLGRILTALVRQERFADGTLATAHDSGLLGAIARRAETLASELDRDDTIGTWDQRPWDQPWSGDRAIVAAAGVTEIGLARSMCYGPCPVYSVTLRRDGRATFVGEQFVDLMGEHLADLDPADFDTMALALAHLRFGTLRRHYAVDHTDAPTTTTWVIRPQRRRIVEDYGDAGPRRLRQIEGLIDGAAAQLTWRSVAGSNVEDGGRRFVDPPAGGSWRPYPEPGERPTRAIGLFAGVVGSRRDGRVTYYRLAELFAHQLLENTSYRLTTLA